MRSNVRFSSAWICRTRFPSNCKGPLSCISGGCCKPGMFLLLTMSVLLLTFFFSCCFFERWLATNYET
jgi:hypothetical protein